MGTIVLLGSAHGFVIDDMRQISGECTFLYDKEHALHNVLLDAFAEMSFVGLQFEKAHGHIIANGTPELAHYLSQLNEATARDHRDFIVELHAFDLSTYFKSFLLLAKAVLDKLAPLTAWTTRPMLMRPTSRTRPSSARGASAAQA